MTGMVGFCRANFTQIDLIKGERNEEHGVEMGAGHANSIGCSARRSVTYALFGCIFHIGFTRRSVGSYRRMDYG